MRGAGGDGPGGAAAAGGAAGPGQEADEGLREGQCQGPLLAGKLAKYAKKTAPTFVALEDDDLDKPGAPLFAVDDVIQVGELRPGEDSVAEGRWFIATVVDYKGEGRGGDSFRLEYRWRNGTLRGAAGGSRAGGE